MEEQDFMVHGLYLLIGGPRDGSWQKFSEPRDVLEVVEMKPMAVPQDFRAGLPTLEEINSVYERHLYFLHRLRTREDQEIVFYAHQSLSNTMALLRLFNGYSPPLMTDF